MTCSDKMMAARRTALDLLRQEDNLGFDTASEALHACRTHYDYRDRWEMSDETASAVDLYNIERRAFFRAKQDAWEVV